jgi:type IV secretion system protein VirB1
MLLAMLTLAASLQSCAADVAPSTMAAVVSVESGGLPLAVHDDTTGRSYAFERRSQAEATARTLLAEGHRIDLGLGQINSANLTALGLDVSSAFEPCTNLRASARLLSEAYAAASARFGRGQVALRHALAAYHSGTLFGSSDYVRRVVAAAEIVER